MHSYYHVLCTELLQYMQYTFPSNFFLFLNSLQDATIEKIELHLDQQNNSIEKLEILLDQQNNTIEKLELLLDQQNNTIEKIEILLDQQNNTIAELGRSLKQQEQINMNLTNNLRTKPMGKIYYIAPHSEKEDTETVPLGALFDCP